LKAFLNWKFVAACPLVSLFAKASFWSRGRIEEMSELRWEWIDKSGYLSIPDDMGKWGKGKVIRLPAALLSEIRSFRSESPYVWAGYAEQLRQFHRNEGHHASAHKIKDFNPQRLRILFQKWIGAWSKENAKGVSHHTFRKTGLQFSREGQLRSFEGEYAKHTNVSLGVADKHYTSETEKLERLRADIAYRNIANEIKEDREFAELMGLCETSEAQ